MSYFWQTALGYLFAVVLVDIIRYAYRKIRERQKANNEFISLISSMEKSQAGAKTFAEHQLHRLYPKKK